MLCPVFCLGLSLVSISVTALTRLLVVFIIDFLLLNVSIAASVLRSLGTSDPALTRRHISQGANGRDPSQPRSSLPSEHLSAPSICKDEGNIPSQVSSSLHPYFPSALREPAKSLSEPAKTKKIHIPSSFRNPQPTASSTRVQGEAVIGKVNALRTQFESWIELNNQLEKNKIHNSKPVQSRTPIKQTNRNSGSTVLTPGLPYSSGQKVKTQLEALQNLQVKVESKRKTQDTGSHDQQLPSSTPSSQVDLPSPSSSVRFIDPRKCEQIDFIGTNPDSYVPRNAECTLHEKIMKPSAGNSSAIKSKHFLVCRNETQAGSESTPESSVHKSTKETVDLLQLVQFSNQERTQSLLAQSRSIEQDNRSVTNDVADQLELTSLGEALHAFTPSQAVPLSFNRILSPKQEEPHEVASKLEHESSLVTKNQTDLISLEIAAKLTSARKSIELITTSKATSPPTVSIPEPILLSEQIPPQPQYLLRIAPPPMEFEKVVGLSEYSDSVEYNEYETKFYQLSQTPALSIFFLKGCDERRFESRLEIREISKKIVQQFGDKL